MRKAGLEEVLRACSKAGCPTGDIYTFGVYSGRSMRALYHKMSGAGVSTGTWYGFDSFEGLPKETYEGNAKYATMQKGVWAEGAYHIAAAFGDKVGSELYDALTAYVEIPPANVQWIKGFYDKTLDSGTRTRHGMRNPVLFVDVDCDLYSSAKTVLDWLFENGVPTKGTVISFDDILAGGGSSAGEGLAWAEAVLKFKISASPVEYLKRPNWPTSNFRIVTYNGMGVH
jgi:hypothetical protein